MDFVTEQELQQEYEEFKKSKKDDKINDELELLE